jgi:transcriptional regulator with XRE-family HTH domain
VSDLNERARQRLREEKDRLKLGERDIAAFTGWSRAKVNQKLAGTTDITLNDLQALCEAMRLPPSEAVRDRGLEFCAEMTPTELRILELLRHLPKPAFDAVLTLLTAPRALGTATLVEPRGLTKKRAILGKPRPR